MNVGELSIQDVRAILATYAGEWADMPIRELSSTGTDNALYMVASDYVLRVPKRETAIKALEKELTWLPKLNGLPLPVPELLFHGKTTQHIGFDFGIFRWHQGHIATPEQIIDGVQAAKTLAHFIAALHRKDVDGAPRAGIENNKRGMDLANLSEATLTSIDIVADEIDATSARAVWELACSASRTEKAVWVHGDLKADNLLAQNGALAAVIDWGLSAVGDPAVDYAAAWTWVEAECRGDFQAECIASKDDWHRAKGWALYCAVVALSFYRGRSHEALCKQSRRTLRMLELC